MLQSDVFRFEGFWRIDRVWQTTQPRLDRACLFRTVGPLPLKSFMTMGEWGLHIEMPHFAYIFQGGAKTSYLLCFCELLSNSKQQQQQQ